MSQPKKKWSALLLDSMNKMHRLTQNKFKIQKKIIQIFRNKI